MSNLSEMSTHTNTIHRRRRQPSSFHFVASRLHQWRGERKAGKYIYIYIFTYIYSCCKQNRTVIRARSTIAANVAAVELMRTFSLFVRYSLLTHFCVLRHYMYMTITYIVLLHFYCGIL